MNSAQDAPHYAVFAKLLSPPLS